MVDRVYPINVKPVLSRISHFIYQAFKLSFKRKKGLTFHVNRFKYAAVGI